MIEEHNNILVIAQLGLFLAVLFILTAMLSGLGTRWSFWDFRAGLTIFRWAAYGETAAVLILLISCIAALFKKPQNALILSVIGLLISITVIIIAVKWLYTAKNVPAIHDITTDTENPPEFDLIINLRKGASNPSEYGGSEISSQQEKAYPDIKPVLIEITPDRGYELCLKTAKEIGWNIVNAKADTGLIEATDRTFWFGFIDDIVIRVTPSGKNIRVDVRSVSRVGRSDVGTNAKRIRRYLKKLRQEAEKI